MSWPPVFKIDAAFFSWSHVTFDLSKIAHLILGQKCLKCFFEIRSLSKFLRKTASFLQHYNFSEMRYLIESGFWRQMILCDAKCSYYEYKNQTKYHFYRSTFQASDPLDGTRYHAVSIDFHEFKIDVTITPTMKIFWRRNK